ncbi:hypothetical protein [Methanoregula boonei]|uniref:hypothetical protein n=1 Tax=Methanoregula boonei TaxID=358766 RepID=UPI00064FB44B|nr:hypothetical protein [Methanoregula boonei]
MADVKYWCSDPAETGRPLRHGRGPVLLRCRKEECAKWDSDLTCPALSLSVTVRGRPEVCYSGGQ